MQLQPRTRKQRSARASFATIIAASLALAAFSQLSAPARAVPVLPEHGHATPSPALPGRDPNALPLNSRLTFVLEGTISSASSKADQLVRAHLKDPIVLGSRTIAPAGTPIEIRILDARPATNPDIYGYVDVYFMPLRLADGRTLPIHPPTAHLNVNVSAGHESTVGIEDTVGDIFTPTALFHVFRKGRNFTLEPGAQIHALTEAALHLAPNGTVAITTPAPIVVDEATPHASFMTVPVATPNPSFHPDLTPKPLDPSTPEPVDRSTPPAL
ncbi:MAG TPA: hypothetical protein VFN49_11455 [Candidatus Aquilonibacter sp.]|nr:hypothetical protein [Candidatus Aquilonibacter sp.]